MLWSKLDELAREQHRRNVSAIETACEAALQTGEFGVLVLERIEGGVMAGVHPRVPFGRIYTAPTAASDAEIEFAFADWIPRPEF